MAKGEQPTGNRPTVSIEIGGNQMSATLPERAFKTGSKGFGMYNKLSDPITGKQYQISFNMIEIGSNGK